MEKEVFYRYVYGRKSIFSKIGEFQNKETQKRFGKEWAKECGVWTRRINDSIKWLPEPELDKGTKFYFTLLGKNRYEQTLFKVHREMLNKKKTPYRLNRKILDIKKLKKLKLICFREKKKKFWFFWNEKFLYNLKTKKKIGKIIYEDKYQIGVK